MTTSVDSSLVATLGSGSPTTLHLSLHLTDSTVLWPFDTTDEVGAISVPSDPAFGSSGYTRQPVTNDSTGWETLDNGATANINPITFGPATTGLNWTSTLPTTPVLLKGAALFDSPTTDTTKYFAWNFTTPFELNSDYRLTIPSSGLQVFTDHIAFAIHRTQLATDLWSGYVGRHGGESGVCSTCRRTVPVAYLVHNKRYGWQCIPGPYSTPNGCFDGHTQRDEIIYVPRPNEGVRQSPTPTGTRTTLS